MLVDASGVGVSPVVGVAFSRDGVLFTDGCVIEWNLEMP